MGQPINNFLIWCVQGLKLLLIKHNNIFCYNPENRMSQNAPCMKAQFSSLQFSSVEFHFTSYPFEIIVCPGPNNSRCIDLVPTELERTSGCVNWYLMASHTSIHHITSHMHVSVRAGCRRKWSFPLYGVDVDAFSVKGTKKLWHYLLSIQYPWVDFFRC